MSAVTRKKDSHNTIVLTSAPVGRFLEGHLNASVAGLKPGHCVAIDATEDFIGGKPVVKAYAGTTGNRALIQILLENEMVGKTPEQAIADGQKVRMYCPINGDELLVRVSAAGTGTGDSLAVNDVLILAQGGTFIKTTGSPQSQPFIVMEAVDDVTADGDLVHVMYTGY
jgi:hypothetical protein